MPRKHTVWDSELGKQVDIPFTPEEEVARDIEEAAWAVQQAAQAALDAQQDALLAKLADDTITLAELREILRLERGL